MAWSLRKRTVEYVIYLLFWSVLLLSPLFGAYIKYAFYKDDTFLPTVEELFAFWVFLLPALILFFINNNILMPFLLYKKRGRHILFYCLCVAVACTIVFISFPVDNPHGAVHSLPVTPLGNVSSAVETQMVSEPVVRRVWMFFVHPNNVRILLVLFVLVFNISVRLFFFTVRRDESIKELEKEKLHSELELLRYQINPHFFMNSLNNIHALIDIDKEKARYAVQNLSGLMRYVLYEKTPIFIPLEREIRFLNDFIELMRLRYTDKLKVTVDFAEDAQGVYVPSLLFVPFVENAFKHGVTYNKKTLINVSLNIDEAGEKVLFVCRNTLPDTAKNAALSFGGIGVENARKRLELLYGGKARLHIGNDGEWYNVELKIPIKYDKVYNS